VLLLRAALGPEACGPLWTALAYAFAGLGLLLGVWLLLDGTSWRFYTGPLLMAVWAVFGAIVDL